MGDGGAKKAAEVGSGTPEWSVGWSAWSIVGERVDFLFYHIVSIVG